LVISTLKTAEVESLYEKHGPALAAYGCCCGLDFASAEDVVQQVFLKLLQGRTLMPQMPVPYLYRAVRNASLNLHRDFRREVEMPDRETWFIGPDGHPEDVLALQAALRELPQDQRETVFLRVWGGLALQEVADTLDVSINTAASRYRYALEKLRERLQPVSKR
jgi:RNA polymerase sigma-70 factor (ECF subfamily)